MEITDIPFGNIEIWINAGFIVPVGLARELIKLVGPLYSETGLGKSQTDSSDSSKQTAESIWSRLLHHLPYGGIIFKSRSEVVIKHTHSKKYTRAKNNLETLKSLKVDIRLSHGQIS